MPRVLIVDDQRVFRHHLRQLLVYAGLDVVGEAADIAEAERLVQTLQPDLAIVDVMLPGVNGLEGTPRLQALQPNLRVILISAQLNHANAFQKAAHEAGAETYIPKDDLNLAVVRAWDREYGQP